MSPEAPSLPTAELICDVRLAWTKMHGAERRSFAAEIALKYCGGSARKTEQVFGWGREMVGTGLGEKRTGILRVSAKANFTGKKRWEEKHPEVAAELCRLAEEHGQQDPSFLSPDYARRRANLVQPIDKMGVTPITLQKKPNEVARAQV